MIKRSGGGVLGGGRKVQKLVQTEPENLRTLQTSTGLWNGGGELSLPGAGKKERNEGGVLKGWGKVSHVTHPQSKGEW